MSASVGPDSVEATTNAWYVAFRKGAVTVMRIVQHRSHAIAVACDMLDCGTEVTGLGPMLETRQPRIDAEAIRRIWRERVRPKAG
jgi:hypothetical protein